jgi:hypothetical protein
VTHPFHPLAGCSVEVLYSMRRGGTRMFVVDTGTGVRMTVPEQWTDRGPAPATARLSSESLAELRALIDAMTLLSATPGGDAS